LYSKMTKNITRKKLKYKKILMNKGLRSNDLEKLN